MGRRIALQLTIMANVARADDVAMADSRHVQPSITPLWRGCRCFLAAGLLI
jgi:hypothetical protein